MEDNSPYMDTTSEYWKKVRKENIDTLFAVAIVVLVIGSVIATLWMAHMNYVLTQVLNQPHY